MLERDMKKSFVILVGVRDIVQPIIQQDILQLRILKLNKQLGSILIVRLLEVRLLRQRERLMEYLYKIMFVHLLETLMMEYQYIHKYVKEMLYRKNLSKLLHTLSPQLRQLQKQRMAILKVVNLKNKEKRPQR